MKPVRLQFTDRIAPIHEKSEWLCAHYHSYYQLCQTRELMLGVKKCLVLYQLFEKKRHLRHIFYGVLLFHLQG